jgi:hypothetical protein
MRCKIGDLAFVVRPTVPSNLGVLVEVIAVWPDAPQAWWVRSLSGPRLRKNGTVAEEGMVPDQCLRPIKGEPGATDDNIGTDICVGCDMILSAMATAEHG